jgi:hypothetical protein
MSEVDSFSILILGALYSVLNNPTFIALANKAASLGLIDKETVKHVEENADQILNNPEKFAKEM